MSDPQNPASPSEALRLAVVVPVHNEVDNVAPLIAEIRAALADGPAFEILYVDDGSKDDTLEKLLALRAEAPELRVLRHVQCCGQSAAVATGVKAARAPIIATLDGDGQNDPADIPNLLATLESEAEPDLLLVAGWRAKRKDTAVKRYTSRFANGLRARLLKDDTPDTGCGLKVFTRAAFLDMPRFDHMHRFLPALMIRRGGRVTSVQVNHRPRERGASKYGTLDRALVGISDLLGVIWLQKRGSVPQVEEPDR
ncbi:glycosyltransferase family 2 protein [Magnetospira sp. QH-2]|uniref:glycosyltransferase family 2 protein n=1 Tax=Magnetospira sp. (strain QH-2) TaxID=1288970 RepID=UPI0003E80A76|nr:glycosyltransferase family 2 protein [Magnetospira sp. QH-2]CCQ72573.1 Putative GT2 : distantly related to GDP-Man: Dol-P b-mannosyltransferase [Magnetospira sp. QH-2]